MRFIGAYTSSATVTAVAHEESLMEAMAWLRMNANTRRLCTGMTQWPFTETAMMP
jgi:hypothetical protein